MSFAQLLSLSAGLGEMVGMDPNATLRDFVAACQRANNAGASTGEREQCLESAVEHAADLFGWLRRGGFPPDWSVLDNGI